MRFKDKVIIITGGGQGIGRVLAHKLAEEGARVVIPELNEARGEAVILDITKKGYEALFIPTDITDEASTEAMARTAAKEYGRLDVLINNAAMFASLELKPFDQIPVREWDEVMAVNLRGSWLCCKAVVPFMKEQKKGKIINTSSNSQNTGKAGYLHYSTSKAGVVGFTRSLATELGEWNINVNCVAYGGIKTEIERKTFTPERLKEIMARQCLKRVPVPEEVVGTIKFLASEDSDFLTGQTIHINGGAFFY